MIRWPFAFLFLLSCSPFIPVQEPAHSAHKQIEAETADATLRLQHLDNQFNHYVFDLEVINYSSHGIHVSPSHNSCYYAASQPFPKSDTLTDIRAASWSHSHLKSKQLYAQRPDVILNKVNQKVKSRDAVQVIFMLVGVGLAVYDGVKDMKDLKKERWTYRDAGKAVGRNALVNSAIIASDVVGESAAKAEEESRYLPHEIFPDLTIQPEEQMRGKLFFPIETNYRYLRVIISLDRVDYVFDFKRASTQAQID